ncbi:MAG: TadE/TadG family type IV pilus assembly protein [Coprococcus sp.]
MTHLLKMDEGSATLEAALILPVFIFAMLVIYSMGCAICTRTVVYEAMQETVQYMAEYAYMYDRAAEAADVDYEGSAAGTAVNVATAYGKLGGYIDDKELVDKYVSGGVSGIIIMQAELNDDGYIYMDIAYQLAVDVPLVGNLCSSVTESIRQKAYLGNSIISDETQEEYVYVAENQSVYHTTRSCYHIRLSVMQISEKTLNSRYSSLKPCDFCVKEGVTKNIVYVTEEGDKYHYSRVCRGLKRTVYRVKKSECQDLPPCSNCGQ